MAKKNKPKFKRAISHEDAKELAENSGGIAKPADDVAVLNNPENFEQPWDGNTKASIADTPISVLDAAYKRDLERHGQNRVDAENDFKDAGYEGNALSGAMIDFDEMDAPKGFPFSGSDVAKMGRNRLSERTDEVSDAPSLRDVEPPVDRGSHPNRRIQNHLQRPI